MKQGALKQDKKDNARSVPFFARYLVGQEDPAAEAAKSTGGRDEVRRRTLKYPSDWDEGDCR
jgi:hypothetical protein